MPRNHELVTRLSQITDPSEVIHVITMQDIIAEIAQRMGEDSLNLSPEDFQLARDEVKAAIDHHLDEQEYIDMGLDAWDIIRNL